eukprot:TRINITY_DN9099_c0_g1_i1.p1 TRINITY_DN9099_c0_g1~~TRINITY_DN9099_c0_g1_i1.p1  ORF type:complete len:315 (-),score=20.35 TRINITY_DN9099_c0_g1_i1:73-1017(-)
MRLVEPSEEITIPQLAKMINLLVQFSQRTNSNQIPIFRQNLNSIKYKIFQTINQEQLGNQNTKFEKTKLLKSYVRILRGLHRLNCYEISIFEQVAEIYIQNFEKASDLIPLIRILGEVRYYVNEKEPSTILQSICENLRNQIQNLNEQQITIIAWSCQQMDHLDAELMLALGNHAIQILPNLNQKQIAIILNAFSNLNFQHLEFMKIVAENMENILVRQGTIESSCSVARSFSKLRFFHQQAYYTLRDFYIQNFERISTQDLSYVCVAFATFVYNDQDFRKFFDLCLEKVIQSISQQQLPNFEFLNENCQEKDN